MGGFNKAFLMPCRNRAFQPTKIKPYNDLFTFSIVPNTGMCIQNAKLQGDDLKHCLDLNKDVQEEDDFYGGFYEKPKEEEHEKYIDDYIASLTGVTDPGEEDYPDAKSSQGNTEDSKEFNLGSGGEEL